MKRNAKEAAKFFAGFSAQAMLMHWWLGTWGTDLLPVEIGKFTLSPELNMFAMAFWPAAFLVLFYLGWLRPHEIEEPRTA